MGIKPYRNKEDICLHLHALWSKSSLFNVGIYEYTFKESNSGIFIFSPVQLGINSSRSQFFSVRENPICNSFFFVYGIKQEVTEVVSLCNDGGETSI